MLTDRERARVGPRSQKAPGSPEWCWQTIGIFKDALRHVNEQYRQAEEIMAELRDVRAWEKVPPESPYGSFDELCKAETGMRASQLTSHIRTAREKYDPIQAASKNGEIGRGRAVSLSGTQAKQERRDAAADVARLKRDDPELAERVVNGEITAYTATREKGWRPPRVELRSPRAVAQRIREHFTPEQVAELRDLLND